MKRLAILFIILAGCTTTTTTLLDGTKTVVRTQDPKVVKILTEAAVKGAIDGAQIFIENQAGKK